MVHNALLGAPCLLDADGRSDGMSTHALLFPPFFSPYDASLTCILYFQAQAADLDEDGEACLAGAAAPRLQILVLNLGQDVRDRPPDLAPP